MRKLLVLALILININAFSQSIIDTIITKTLDTIPCQVSYVNNYSVFYKISKRKKLKDKVTPRIDILKLIVNTKGITVKKEKFDSGINDYFRKSNLNKKYETLLLRDNTDPSLILLADSIIKTKKADYLYVATMIQAFANQYKCKIVYFEDNKQINQYHIKLYDAPDTIYQKTLKSYKQNKIICLRTNNNLDYKEVKFKINNEKITLLKDQYYSASITDLTKGKVQKNKELEEQKLDLSNQYVYIGQTDYYTGAANLASVLGSIALGALTGILSDIVIVVPMSAHITMNNFIGEFIMLHTKPKN